MTIPIPKYLEDIASKVSEKKNIITILLKCKCGCNNFFVISNDDKTKNSQLEMEFIKRFGKGFEAHSNEKGEVLFIKRNIFGKIVDSANAKDYRVPQNRITFMAKCSQCNSVHIIYDNWKNGYNSLDLSDESKVKINEISRQDQKNHTEGKAKNVLISFRIDDNNDIKTNATNVNSSREDLSNLFSEITIYLSENGIRDIRKIYQEETR